MATPVRANVRPSTRVPLEPPEAVVPPVAQEMMVRYDPVVRHYREIFTLLPAPI